MRKNFSSHLYWTTFIILLTLTCISLFAKLGSGDIHLTDEATHAINAYEMIQNKNFWINTLNYEIDYYNTKPPLMLWLIILGYKIFGYTPLGLRFFSAVSGLAIYLITYLWIFKVRGKNQALIFAAFFPACNRLFNFHMLRSGDMDSVYSLFFLLSIIFLYKAHNKINYLILYGALLGLAFMTKSTHCFTILIIGILFLPFLKKKNSTRTLLFYYLSSYLVSLLVILPWMIVRINFDGFIFFADMLFGETLGRVQGNYSEISFYGYFDYLIQLLKEPVCLVSILLIAITLYTYFLSCKFSILQLSSIFKKTDSSYVYFYLLSVWFIVVVGLYSIVKADLSWYIYSAYIPLVILGSEALTYLSTKLNEKRYLLGHIITYTLIILSIFLTIYRIHELPWHGSGGSPRINFYDTVMLEQKESGRSLSKKTMYIENAQNSVFERTRWEHDYIFYAISTLDVICKDGGVQAFLDTSDKNSLLVLDKSLWKEYESDLTGYIILEDLGYLIFSKYRYGE